ncbi:hypothetical protein [Vibrio tetraodonis]|uniref:hypothetical protein n=1 Tax=Vibrio tetraodonis TaxID=2231647 RepID=UPI000E0AA4E3|nr:hypothetical protein [Vibrio tetraodonis]
MTEIITSETPEDKEIILGDDSSNQAISFKLAQAFYNEITGKSERVTEDFNPSFILTMDNISQLHHRIIQSTTQYNVQSANASFSVEYVNDSSERFSSIERFMAHAGSKGQPVEEVAISYNLLVVLPQTHKPQEYRINILLASRSAKVEGMKEQIDVIPFSIPLWQFESKFTCRASVDFVDITVANSFMSVIKNWIDCLEVTSMNPVLKWVRPTSKYLPLIGQYSLLAIGAYFTNQHVSSYFENPEPTTTASFVLIAFLFNFLLFKFGRFIGYKSERHLDSIYQLSYIDFSGADRRLATESSSSVKKNIVKSIAYILFSITVALVSNELSKQIFIS